MSGADEATMLTWLANVSDDVSRADVALVDVSRGDVILI